MAISSTPSTQANTTRWSLQIDVLVVVLALCGAALIAGVMWLRAQYPSAGFLAEPASNGWKVTAIERDAAQGGLPAQWLGSQVMRACSVNERERCVTLQPEWMIDSPIALPTARAISNFVNSQQALRELAFEPGEQVVLHGQEASGKAMSATVTLQASREFISERFALILLAAVMMYTVGCAMLAFVRRTREVWLAFGMCAGFFLFMVMRSWYTNRTWAQPEAMWWLVIELFRVGVMTCGVASLMTVWNLRLSGVKTWFPLSICAVLCSVVLLHALGLIDSAAWGYRAVTLVFLILILSASFAAWWLSRGAGQGERLRSKTFGRILLIGFLPLMVTMPLWTFRPDLQQIAFLQNMAVGLSGIPVVIVVSQSAQYQLHAFWWRLWLVLVAAVLALISAAILVVFSSASASVSLALMIALAGVAIYFLRNWLEKRLIGKPAALDGFLPQIMQMQGMQGQELDSAWRQMLKDAFAPQRIDHQPLEGEQPVRLLRQGDTLEVPALGGTGALVLTGASNFTRSFGFADVQLAQSLHALAQQGLAARASYLAGAVQERRRIAADLHDDIGGKLLHLANHAGAEGQYARNTLEDLRTITRGLSAQPRALPELLADIQYQLGQRAERGNIELDWLADIHNEHLVIGSRQSTVLASVCSELMRNAMQHRGVQRVSFVLRSEEQTFSLICSNDGAATDPAQWTSGLGTTSVRRRVHDLQGQCQWEARAGGGVRFSASWPLLAWLSSDTGAFQAGSLLPEGFKTASHTPSTGG